MKSTASCASSQLDNAASLAESTSQESSVKFVRGQGLTQRVKPVTRRTTVSDNLRNSWRSSVTSNSVQQMTQNSQSIQQDGTEMEEFLLHFKDTHPLAQLGLTKFQQLVKGEDFHLYSCNQGKKNLLLKVICDPGLFYNELAVITRLKTLAFNSTTDKPGASRED